MTLSVGRFLMQLRHSTVDSLRRGIPHRQCAARTDCSNKALILNQDRLKGFKALYWTPATRLLRGKYPPIADSIFHEARFSILQLRWPHHVFALHTASQALTDSRKGNRLSVLITLALDHDCPSTRPLFEALLLHRVRLHK